MSSVFAVGRGCQIVCESSSVGKRAARAKWQNKQLKMSNY